MSVRNSTSLHIGEMELKQTNQNVSGEFMEIRGKKYYKISNVNALFPYYTEDKLTENSENTGIKTIFIVNRSEPVHVGDIRLEADETSDEWRATVVITVHDAEGNPVKSITVTAGWVGIVAHGETSAQTDARV